MKSGKISSVSLLRVIATLLIVLCHSFAFYSTGWPVEGTPQWPLATLLSTACSNIGLIFFMFISGYLYATFSYKGRYADKRRFLLGKCRRIVVPYLFWCLLHIVLMPQYNSLSGVVLGMAHLWFLAVLMVLFVLATLTEQLWRRSGPVTDMVAVALMLMLYVGVVMLRSRGIYVDTNPKLLIYYMPVFYCAILSVKYDWATWVRAHSGWSWLAAALCVTSFLVSTGLRVKVGVVLVSLSLLCFLLIVLLDDYASSHPLKGLPLLIERHSMAVYLIHHTMIWLAMGNTAILQWLSSIRWWGVPVIFCSTTAVALAVGVALSRWPKVYRVVFG